MTTKGGVGRGVHRTSYCAIETVCSVGDDRGMGCLNKGWRVRKEWYLFVCTKALKISLLKPINHISCIGPYRPTLTLSTDRGEVSRVLTRPRAEC